MRFFRLMIVAAGIVFAAACDEVPPTPTPTRSISGPTLAPSAVVLPVIPTVPPLDVGQSDLTAASLPRDAELPPLEQGTRAPGAVSQQIVITLANGTQHPGDLYAPSGGGITPGVLMLGVEEAAWNDLPARLREAGITALVTTVPQSATIADFDSLLSSLGETSDPGHLAVIGFGTGADAAFIGCASVMQCDAAVLIYPTRDTLINAMPDYNPRPLFAAAPADDAETLALAQGLIDIADGEKQLYPLPAETLDTAAQQAVVAWLISQLG